MNLNIKYTELGNKFFFISNLAEWHFSCRERYNLIWLKKTGKFSKKESSILKLFGNILKKYDFKKYLGHYFIVEKNKNKAWKKIMRNTTKKEFKIISEVFDIFGKRFEKVWKTEILEKNSEILKKELKRNKYKKIQTDLDSFFGKPSKILKSIDIFLLKHPEKNTYLAGGANLGGKGLTIECNEISYPINEFVERTMAVIYHELIHILYGKNIRKIIRKTLLKAKINEDRKKMGRPIKDIMEEIIICTVFPSGFLSEKYFSYGPYKIIENNYKNIDDTYLKQIKSDGFNKMRNYLVYKLYPVVKKYIKNRKKIDLKFIENVLEELKIVD